jgi:hypothetical protein
MVNFFCTSDLKPSASTTLGVSRRRTSGPTLHIGDIRFDGEFRRESGLVLLGMSFVDLDP